LGVNLPNEIPSDLHDYFQGLSYIDELKTTLNQLGISPDPNSYFSKFYAQSKQLLDCFTKGAPIIDEDRAAFASLLELSFWLDSIKTCSEFSKIKPHLKLLEIGTPSISTGTSYIYGTPQFVDHRMPLGS
jgi:hypothetical protein